MDRAGFRVENDDAAHPGCTTSRQRGGMLVATELVVAPFFGESRHLLVDGLVDIYDGVRSSGESRWVSLEAPPGWGKTRLGRELYARLAKLQSQPRYWPADFGDPSRKVTNPGNFDHAAGSLPEFLWWGITCSARNDVPTNSLRHDLEQLDRHAAYVEDAWKQSTPARMRLLAASRSAGRALTTDAAMTAAAEAAVATIGFATGLGALVRGVGHLHAKAKETRARRDRSESEEPVGGDETNDIVDKTIEMLSRVTETRFPIVLFVEDLHLADNVLIEFIDELLTSVTHVFTITTARPSKIEENPYLNACLQEHAHRIHRVNHMLLAGKPFPSGASLATLENDAMESIVRSYFPEVTPTTLTELLKRYNSPWELELICRLPKYKRQHPRLDLDSKSLLKLPKDIKDLHREHWNQLPDSFQIGLAVASVIIPNSINEAEAGGMNDWDRSLLYEIMTSFEMPDIDLSELMRQTTHKENGHGWIQTIDEYLRAFVEAAQLEIASDDRDHLLERFMDDAREEILKHLAMMTQNLPDASNSIHRARTVLSLHAEGYIKDINIVATAIEAVLSDLEDAPRELDERCRLFAKYLDLAKNAPHEVSSETTFSILYQGATALGEAGRVDEAIAAYRELLAGQQRILGKDHPDTLSSRHNLAFELGNAGRVEEATIELQQVLSDSRTILGNYHPDTLMSQGNLAYELGHAGREREAIVELRQVLTSRQRILGDEHHDTLATRDNIAFWLGEAGWRDEALLELRQVLPDRQRILGEYHRDTLTTRYKIATQLGHKGRVEDAMAELRLLLADQRRELGDTHPDTLTTRHDIAYWLSESGRHEEAIAAYRELLADRQRILKVDHHHTLKTRGLLARELGCVGRVEEAIVEYRDLLPDFQRKLTDNHPDTLTAREILADLLLKSGRVQEALVAYRDLLVDRRRILGDDHPQTQRTNRRIAALHKEDDLDE